MIYHQSSLYYFLTIVTTIGLSRRLKLYLEDFITPTMSIVVTTAILLHPLSIDAILAPNLVRGPVAFWLFLEALFMQKENKLLWTLALSFLSALCNVGYSLFPLYFLYKANKNEKKKYIVPGLIYIFLLGIYFGKLALISSHNPFMFFSYFFQNLTVPLTLNVFKSSLGPFSIQSVFLASMILLVIIWREEKNKASRPFWAFLFLPVVGVFIHQWTEEYRFWSEVIFIGSDFLVITFAFMTMLAIHLPKKAFVGFFVFLMFVTFDWGLMWKPYSSVLRESVLNLPEEYKELVQAKRSLAWQLIYEGKYIEARRYLAGLIELYPSDESLKNDLELLNRGELQTLVK